MTFWQWFFLFLIYIPLLIMWAVSLADIFMRSDLSGGAKALWVAAMFVFPWLGLLVYLWTRPPGVPGALATKLSATEAQGPVSIGVGQELEQLARLRSQGAITEAEYASAKAKVLAGTQSETKAA